MADLIQPTDSGLYCAAGDFHIDPWKPVPYAVITHSHSDHLRWGCGRYLCAERGKAILQERAGSAAPVDTLHYGQSITRNGVTISLHPAGHILGSAQVRLEYKGEVWAASGDYKTVPDGTCEPFEPVKCDVFITESTFGLPIYHWRPQAEIAAEINSWWRTNQELDRTSVIFTYSLGKAQRVLTLLDESIGPIVVHGAVARFVPIYESLGVRMPPVERGTVENAKDFRGRALVIAPPACMGASYIRKFAPHSLGFVSGWMTIRGTRRRQALDRGFVLSDHADWEGLLGAIGATGAQRVGVTHGYTDVLTRYLREQGKDAWVIPTLYQGEQSEDADTVVPDSEGGDSLG